MDKKKQNILIEIISVIGVAIIVLMLFLMGKDQVLGNDDNTYRFSFKVYYEDNALVIDDILEFEENETLLQVMEKNYTITTKKDAVSTAVLSIDSYTSDFTTSYFSLYINGTYSATGPKDIILTGGLEVEWKWIKL